VPYRRQDPLARSSPTCGKRSFQKAVRRPGRSQKYAVADKARAMNKSTRSGARTGSRVEKNVRLTRFVRSRPPRRVPKPRAISNDVLVMEVVTDSAGDSRALDWESTGPLRRREYTTFSFVDRAHADLGLIHGDLSEFKFSSQPDGTVITTRPKE